MQNFYAGVFRMVAQMDASVAGGLGADEALLRWDQCAGTQPCMNND